MKLWPLLGRVGPLTPAFPRFPVAPEQAVHGGLRAQVGAIVQGAAPHLGDSQVAVVGPVQQLQHSLAFSGAEGIGWGRPGTRRSTPRRPTASVVGGPGPTEQLTGPLRPDRFSQFGVVVVDDHLYFSSVSTLSEMPSKSTCAFSMMSSAVLVLASSASERSYSCGAGQPPCGQRCARPAGCPRASRRLGPFSTR